MEAQITPPTPPATESESGPAFFVTGFPTLQEVERQYLNLVLKHTGGNKVQAAKILGVSVKTIYNKLDSYREVVRNNP